MLRLIVIGCLVMALTGVLFGGTIELWDGTKATDVTIGDVKDGYLSVTTKSGPQRIQLTKIKNVVATDGGKARIIRFVDFKEKSRSGKLLSISVDSDQPRMTRPFVRVLVCSKNKRDEFELYSYQNSRVTDPTNYGKLDEVDASDFKERHYELVRSDGIAFRVEIWQHGRLAAAEVYGDETHALPAEWYMKMEVRSTRSLKVGDEIGTETTIEQLVEDEDSDTPMERGWRISSVSTLPEPLTSQPRVKVSYQYVNPAENTAVSPKIVIYYVTKNAGGDLEIANMTVDGGGKELPGTKGLFRGSTEKKMSGTIRLTTLETQNTDNASQLVHWRVELIRDDQVVAIREKQGGLEKTLPKEWWK